MDWSILLLILSWIISIGIIGFVLSYFISVLRAFTWPFLLMWLGGIIAYVIIQIAVWFLSDYTVCC